MYHAYMYPVSKYVSMLTVSLVTKYEVMLYAYTEESATGFEVSVCKAIYTSYFDSLTEVL